MAEEIEWQCTDPNLQQFGRRISTNVFEFKENNRFKDINQEGDLIEMTINLEEYSWKQIYDIIEGYYPNLDELFAQYGSDSSFIIAECIFEQESGLY